MVTFAQAQERAEEWINGDVPAYLHREVRVREFGLGFVVWAEDREEAPTPDGDRLRLVIARDSGEATLWPGLPVGEVIRRYEEEYGAAAEAAAPVPAQAAARVDLNQTSFLLSPPEWLQEAADKIGLPPVESNASQATASASAEGESAAPAPADAGAGASPAAVSSAGGAGPDAPVEASASPWAAGAGARPSEGEGGPEGSGAGTSGVSNLSTTSGVSSTSSTGGASGASGGEVPSVSGGSGADAVGAPEVSAEASASPWAAPAEAAASASGAVAPSAAPAGPAGPSASADGGSVAEASAPPAPAPVVPAESPAGPATPPPAYEPTANDGVPAQSPWADANASVGGADGAVPLPATVFAPPLSGADDEDTPPPSVGPDAPTALMKGGSALPPTAIAPRLKSDGTFGQGGPRVSPPPPGAPASAADIADAATSKAATPPPAGTYVRTQLVSQLPDGPPAPPGAPAAPAPTPPGPPGPPTPPGPPAPPSATPPPAVHQAATMLAHPSQGGPGAPPPPPPPPGVPGGGTPAGGVQHAATMLAHPSQGGPGTPPPPPPPPGVPGGGTPPAGVAHAATMLAQPGPAGPPPPPGPAPAPAAQGQAPAYGYPQPQPTGLPTVGPGYQAVLRYRAPDGSEQQIIRRSAPGTPHPEWQILHELRGMNVPPQQVLELHTELESCELPGGYCARMIRETWPQARITNIAPYGRDHAGRQQGMRQLLTHQGELHQVADGPARPAPVRAPLPQVQPAPPLPPDGVAQELAGAFGPGILRFDQRAVSRQGVPELVAVTLMWAGLPADFGPFFWAQPAMPVVPTLAELAAQRQVQPASDASSYLVLGSDFGRAICVQYGTANIVAVPVEAGPGGQPVPPQFVNTGLPELVRCLALLGRMWRLRFGLNPEQAGRWTADFQAQLAMLDPAALSSPENWWSVLLEQMWDGLL
ncbi:SUKH-4 family immunity protein [Streptomyces sp. NPDC051921]|uniref:SUKH-4 family immunity protein n=1 Tax=Streptomyces sp. NPDC051921 TaxID=3155806 RepID=UPI00343803DD